MVRSSWSCREVTNLSTHKEWRSCLLIRVVSDAANIEVIVDAESGAVTVFAIKCSFGLSSFPLFVLMVSSFAV